MAKHGVVSAAATVTANIDARDKVCPLCHFGARFATTAPRPQRAYELPRAAQENLNDWPAVGGKTLERAKGIEPSYAAWEAAVLPLNYARKRV